jgi:hypothetical protein
MEAINELKRLWIALPKAGKIVAVIIPLAIIGALMPKENKGSNDTTNTNATATAPTESQIEYMAEKAVRSSKPEFRPPNYNVIDQGNGEWIVNFKDANRLQAASVDLKYNGGDIDNENNWKVIEIRD